MFVITLANQILQSNFNTKIVKSISNTTVSTENTRTVVVHNQSHMSKSESNNSKTYKWEIMWYYVIGFFMMHVFVIYGAYIMICGLVQIKTLIYAAIMYFCTGMGITAGCHRLWCHRTYSARLPLRILLAIFQTMAYQFNIYKWVRDHRVHHKHTDTDADPYNSTRGFFFSHIGWLLVRRQPEVIAAYSKIDMSDVMADPVVAWQRKHYAWLGPLATFVLPPLVSYYFWNEDLLYSYVVIAFFRYIMVLHFTFLVNSVAHIWGTKPYDKNISSTQNVYVAYLSFGEGWHNYHHIFPWDYKANELGNFRTNFTTAFINASEFLGLAYNLKTVDPDKIKRRCRRTGEDGIRSH